MPRSSSSRSKSRSRSRSSRENKQRKRRHRHSSSSSSSSGSSRSHHHKSHRYQRKSRSNSRDRNQKRKSRSRSPSPRRGCQKSQKLLDQDRGQRFRQTTDDRPRPPFQNNRFPQRNPDMMGKPIVPHDNHEPFKKKFLNDNDPINKKDPNDVKEFRKKHEIFIRSNHSAVPYPVFTFDEVTLFPRAVTDEIRRAGFKIPTPIQSQAFPIALSGNDLIGIAQTGSGKTLAFLLPAIVHILQSKSKNNEQYAPISPQDGPIALILSPTRELTLQIMEQFQLFASKTRLQAACLYGGQDKYIQRAQLRNGAHLIIACPGRLIDFIESHYTNLNRVTYLVLDEADRMLDMGFEPQIRKILSLIRPDKQTMLFSATWPKDVQQLALDFCQENPIHIQIGDQDLAANKKILQKIHVLRSDEKNNKYKFNERIKFICQAADTQKYYPNKKLIIINSIFTKKFRLLSVLHELPRDSKVIIFCATKKGCEGLSRQMYREGFKCISIHGDKSQKDRDHAMDSFRDNRVRVLIATDVASRGLDVRDINYVINYDMPKVIEDYVHRIGRTGRAGAQGISITLFAHDEDGRLARDLIGVLKQGDQEIPKELTYISTNHRSKISTNSFYKKRVDGGGDQMKQIRKPNDSWNNNKPDYFQKPSYQQYMPYMNKTGGEDVPSFQQFYQPPPQPEQKMFQPIPSFYNGNNGYQAAQRSLQPQTFMPIPMVDQIKH